MRALRRTAIALAVLVLLLVAADRIAVAVVEHEAAEKISDSPKVQVTGGATVDIAGFPFLTQVADRDLPQVRARLKGLRTRVAGKPFEISRVDATLHDVRLSSGYDSGVADRAEGTALIPYAQLSRIAPAGVKLGWGGTDASDHGLLQVTGKISLFGHTFTPTVSAGVQALDGTSVSIRASSVPHLGMPGIDKAVRQRTNFVRKIAGLPEGFRLDKVAPTKRGLQLRLSGTKVPLGH